jgi:fused signal recognition particle receptor
MSFFSRFFNKEKEEDLDKGLEKTKEGFFGKIARAVSGKTEVDEEVLDELESILISSDVGLDTTVKIIKRIEERVKKDKFINTDELNFILRDEIVDLLAENNIEEPEHFDLPIHKTGRPFVMLVVGVNGVGKTN